MDIVVFWIQANLFHICFESQAFQYPCILVIQSTMHDPLTCSKLRSCFIFSLPKECISWFLVTSLNCPYHLIIAVKFCGLFYANFGDFPYDIYGVHLSLQDGLTALMVASYGGHVECVNLLLERGAQVNQQDNVSAIL